MKTHNKTNNNLTKTKSRITGSDKPKFLNKIFLEIKYKINLWTLGVTLLLILMCILISLWKPFPGLEQWTQDYRQRSRLAGMNNLRYPKKALNQSEGKLPLPTSSNFATCFDVCIIAQDENSIHKLDGTPFSPEEYAQVIYMLEEFGVDVIVFDKLFFEQRKKHFPRGNENMLTAIKQAKDFGINTVVGWKYELNSDPNSNELIPLGPTEDVKEITKRGFLNVILSETDKSVREYGFLYEDGASLALAAYLSAINPNYNEVVTSITEYIKNKPNLKNNEILQRQLTLAADSQISKPRTIEFYGKPGTIPVIPFYELIKAFNLLHPDYAKCETYEEKYLKLKQILISGANEEIAELLEERKDYEAEIKKLEENKIGKSEAELVKIEQNIKTYKEDFIAEIDAEIAEIKKEIGANNIKTLDKVDTDKWSIEQKAFFEQLKSMLSRKVAVVGPWSLDSQDLYNVPITSSSDAEARMYGVEIHATMIQNLFDIMNSQDPMDLNGFTYPENSEVIKIIIALVLITGILTIFLSPLWSSALIILGAISYWFGSSYSFAYETHFYPIVYPVFSVLATFIAMTITKFFATDKQRRQIDGMFKNYVDRRFVDLLKRDPSKIKLGGERKEISVFFSDIAGFSTFSESMQPEEIVEILNKYLGAMTEIILEYDGTVDKYIGDAVMAFWNAPLNLKDHAKLACIAALMQRKRLYELREDWMKQGYPEIDCRMGINTGQIVHANMGSSLRKNYTLMGDPVNLAARFEPLNKDFSTNIIIGERTYELAKEEIIARPLGKVQVKGRSEPVKFFELIGLHDEIDSDIKSKIETFSTGLHKFYEGDFISALKFFDVVIKSNPDDGPSIKYIELCRFYIENKPELSTWTGAYVQTSK